MFGSSNNDSASGTRHRVPCAGMFLYLIIRFAATVFSAFFIPSSCSAVPHRHATRLFFQDVKCPGCVNISTVYSHAQTVVLCGNCSQILCSPTGGKARLSEGASAAAVVLLLRWRGASRRPGPCCISRPRRVSRPRRISSSTQGSPTLALFSPPDPYTGCSFRQKKMF